MKKKVNESSNLLPGKHERIKLVKYGIKLKFLVNIFYPTRRNYLTIYNIYTKI